MAQIRGKKLHIKTTGEFCGEFWKLFYLKEEQMAYLGKALLGESEVTMLQINYKINFIQ